MPSSKPPLYNVVPAEDAQHPLGLDSSATRLQPNRLDNSWLTTGLRLFLDLLVASISLLFAIFGFFVYRSHGKPAGPDSTGLFIICLWSLSPLGSQASLRVISIIPSYPNTLTQLTAQNTLMEYRFGSAQGISQASTEVAFPAVSSMMAALLLSGRNQDLWGNIRFPAIEPLEKDGGKGWLKTTGITNPTYASLVGTPIDNLPTSGNTSFILPGSYLFISCSSLERSDQSDYSNFNASAGPVPDRGNDCDWFSRKGGTQYQIAISRPCPNVERMAPGVTRHARKLIWESRWDADGDLFTRAERSLTTTFVDVNVSCTGSSSGNICNPSAVRHSLKPTFHYNYTVFDMDFVFDAQGFLILLTGLFPLAQTSGGKQPILSYLTTPYQILGRPLDDIPLHTVGINVFGMRLSQIFNTILYIGINPAGFTGRFNTSALDMLLTSSINITATNTLKEDVIHCNKKWLAVLLLASFTAFFFVLVGAFLRVISLAPDVLGSSTLALLHNKVEGITGLSTWSSETWARNLKDLRLFFGDVEPQAQVGRIALTTNAQETVVNPVNKDRYYI